jgi:hypothetical protein
VGSFCAFTGIIVVLGFCASSPTLIPGNDSADSAAASSTTAEQDTCKSDPDKGYSMLAYNTMARVVKKRLRAPSTAEFPGLWTKKDHVQYRGDGVYEINSWVSAENGFGGKVRTRFNGKIQRDRGDWSLVSLQVNE